MKWAKACEARGLGSDITLNSGPYMLPDLPRWQAPWGQAHSLLCSPLYCQHPN